MGMTDMLGNGSVDIREKGRVSNIRMMTITLSDGQWRRKYPFLLNCSNINVRNESSNPKIRRRRAVGDTQRCSTETYTYRIWKLELYLQALCVVCQRNLHTVVSPLRFRSGYGWLVIV